MKNSHKIPINIAGMLIELSSPLSASELGIENQMGPFFGYPEKQQGAASLVWEESEGPPVPRGKLVYDPGSIWKMYYDGDYFYAALDYQVDSREVEALAVLRVSPGWDDLQLSEQRKDAGWQSLLNIGAGELIARTLIIFSGGLIFHASALDDNGRGLVFIGHAGAGKSTHTALWSGEPGVIAMNDDRVAIRVEDKGPVAYGTPWGGTAGIARNHAAPLKALFVLEQAPENAVEALPVHAAAATLLMARAFLPFWDSSLMVQAMDNLNTILKQVPVYRLRFRPDRAVISLVRSVL